MNKSIWSHSEIQDFKTALGDKKVVLAGGCFDLIHYGHFTFLQKAKTEGEILVIALEPDEFILQKKKRKPVHTQKQRAEILAALEQVDFVLLLPFFKSNEEYHELVKTISPHVIAITEGDTNYDFKKKQAESVQATVKVVSSILPEFSTTQIVHYENISSS